MFDHLIPERIIKRLSCELSRVGITELYPYSKGTTSVVFLARTGCKRLVVKLQRVDSPRNNFRKEAELLRILTPYSIAPKLVTLGEIEGLPYIVRELAEGTPILYADVERKHVLEIAYKTATLDRLGLDHGQIQGGKHIIIGDSVWIIDFEKAGWRRPRNLTSAMAMMFLNENAISRRLREKFSIERTFLEELKGALRAYKRERKLSPVLDVLSAL